MPGDVGVRGLWTAATVPGVADPFATVHIKVLYPSRPVDDGFDMRMGTVPPDSERAPFPLVVFFPGVNVAPESYVWLGVELARRGFVFASFAWITEIFPGEAALSHGIDIEAVKPGTYGTRPSAVVLQPVLDALEGMNKEGPLAGLLDTSRVVLGGHSAGATLALQSADPRFFPTIVGAFAYGGHNAGPLVFGWPENSIMPLPSELPLLLLGGTADGVISGTSVRYGRDPDALTDNLIQRTFDEGVMSSRGDAYFALLNGANHFTPVHPHDPTMARGFLDGEESVDGDGARGVLSELIADFCDAASGRDGAAAERLQAWAERPGSEFAIVRRK